VLLPSGSWRLQLVVEIVHDVGIHGNLLLYLCRTLLLVEVNTGGCGVDDSLLWLHDNHDNFRVPLHGFHWLLRLLLVRSKDLWRRQSRLNRNCRFSNFLIRVLGFWYFFKKILIKFKVSHCPPPNLPPASFFPMSTKSSQKLQYITLYKETAVHAQKRSSTIRLFLFYVQCVN